MTRLESSLKLISEKEGFECYGSVSNEIVKRMEQRLDIVFPNTYREFLKCWGFVEWFGHSIYGYSEDIECRTVEYTLELRDENIPDEFSPLPKSGCVIESYAGGGVYFLYSDNSDRAGEVVLLVDELYGKEVQSWKSFEDFLDYVVSL